MTRSPFKTELPKEGYQRYYDSYVECDFCGASTRGRVHVERPHSVVCGSCSRIIAELDNGEG